MLVRKMVARWRNKMASLQKYLKRIQKECQHPREAETYHGFELICTDCGLTREDR